MTFAKKKNVNSPVWVEAAISFFELSKLNFSVATFQLKYPAKIRCREDIKPYDMEMKIKWE